MSWLFSHWLTDLFCGQYLCATEDEELHPRCVEQVWPHRHRTFRFGAVLQVTLTTHWQEDLYLPQHQRGYWGNSGARRDHCQSFMYLCWQARKPVSLFLPFFFVFFLSYLVVYVHNVGEYIVWHMTRDWLQCLLFQNVPLVIWVWTSCDGHRFYGLHTTPDPYLCHSQTAWAQDHHCWQNGECTQNSVYNTQMNENAMWNRNISHTKGLFNRKLK